MARKKLITRRTISTRCNVSYVVEGTNNDPVTVELIVSGKYKDKQALMKKASESLNVENARVFNVEILEVMDEIRVMTEEKWLAESTPSPTRFRQQ